MKEYVWKKDRSSQVQIPSTLVVYLVFSADQNGQFDRFERFCVPLRADVSKYRPEAYKSEKLKNQKKIHRVALVELLSEIYFFFRFDDYCCPRKIILVSGPPGPVFRVGTVSYEKIVFKIKTN